MNANAIWAGNDYAVVEGKGRGVTWYSGATRVRAIRVYQERDYGSERARTMVECTVLTEDGEPRKAISGDNLVRSFRARDFFMRWEEYANERDYRARERERLNREAEEQEAKEQEAKTRIIDALEEKGIERAAVSSISDYAIVIKRPTIERWLGLNGGSSAEVV